MIIVESAESYYQDFIKKLDSLKENESSNFFSGSKNYRITRYGPDKYYINGTKGYDKSADNYLKKMDETSNYGGFSKSQVVRFLKIISQSLWDKKGKR